MHNPPVPHCPEECHVRSHTGERRSAAHFHHADTHPEPAIKIIEILAWKCCWVARDSAELWFVCVCVCSRAHLTEGRVKNARAEGIFQIAPSALFYRLSVRTLLGERPARRKHSENMRRRVIQLEWAFRMQPVFIIRHHWFLQRKLSYYASERAYFSLSLCAGPVCEWNAQVWHWDSWIISTILFERAPHERCITPREKMPRVTAALFCFLIRCFFHSHTAFII
jgi:hypothetical protein